MSKRLAYPYLAWIVGFIIIPILFICYYGLTRDGHFTFSNIAAITENVHWIPLVLSVRLSLICVVICLLISIPLGLALRSIRSRFLVFLFMMPMWMNTVLSILAWKLLLGTNGIIGRLFHVRSILNTQLATEIGMVYDLLPFAIIPIYNAFASIDDSIIDAAYDLGADRAQVLTKIMLPGAKAGILSAVVMVFVPALTSFVISDMLGGGKVSLIGNVIEQEFTNSMDWNLGSGLGMVLMVFVLLSTMLLRGGES
ncbi:MAG: ABC transporter permease [Lachnospiraceae bacterium]|nr:ABC transporter permease [Lachnospiraceae bacterium]